MSLVVAFHSFHRGVGKTFTTVNLAVALAARGQRVAVVDSNLQSPAAHYPFGLRENALEFSLNDYLHGRSDIQQATYNITPQLKREVDGQIYLTPASLEAEDILQVVRQGYNLDVFRSGLDDLADKLNLDFLLVDTHAGLDEQTLKIIALSDSLVVVMRLEQQEYQGTGVTVDVARKFDLSSIQIVVNQTPPIFTTGEIENQIKKAYDCPLLISAPFSNEVAELGGAEIFVLSYPKHSITEQFNRAAERLTAS